MDLNVDFKSYQDRITSSLVHVTKTASQISNQDIGFYRSSSDKFSKSLDAQSAHLLRLTNKLLKAASKDTPIKAPSLQLRDDIEDEWRGIVDIIDDVLEKADRSLDEFTGVIKRLSPARQDASETSIPKTRSGQGVGSSSHISIPKPQLLFERKVDNYESLPWRPLLATKPHANMPLEDSIGTGEGGFKHPYAHEIQHMIYPHAIYEIAAPIPYSPSEESRPIFVDTEEAVQEMLTELKLAKEIAIDVEHNDRNSFIGLVCLVQISTREKDWIVDTLKPWRENLQVLNEVFANPRIIKVLHGSTSDIIWLQRDLGLYIVGLFDTYHACNVLQFPAKSLKYLLQRFANFEAQKQFQLADWRVRPLPQELIDYARSDTHFLLHVYDNLRNMLLEASTPRENFVEHVLDASRREAMQVYERPIYDKENGLNQGGWMRLLLQRATRLTNEQLGIFRAIHQWRDQKARELDEGEQNIMPNGFLWTIAETAPTYRGAFHQRGIGRLPRYVAENIPEIIEVVKQGMLQGKDGPSVHELIEKHGSKAGFMFGRNKYVRKRADESHTGVGATLQMLHQNGAPSSTSSAVATPPAESVPASEPIAAKAIVSHLWGRVEPLAIPHTAKLNIFAQALDNVLPLPDVLRQPFVSTESLPAVSIPQPQSLPVESASTTNGVTPAQTDKEETFIIREKSRKRKASDNIHTAGQSGTVLEPREINLVTQPDNIPMNADPEAQIKQQLKEARKMEKRAKKAAMAQERIAAQAAIAPFDYVNADSVLHAVPDTTGDNGDPGYKGRDQRPINPFIRALDTSTGARRNKMSKELAGRSHTFQS